jgi:cytochrome c-type biogenesis protein CcsB
MDITLFKLALVAYLASTLSYIASLSMKRVAAAKVATGAILAAFVIHTLSLIARWIETGRVPVIGLYETLSLFAWVMTAAYLAFQIKTKTRVLGAFVSPVAFILALIASVRLGGEVAMPPILQGSMVAAHVILSVAGEALFAVASCAGLMYMIQDGLLKRKKAAGFIRFLPSLKDLDNVNHLCLLWGFPLLTLGIVAGSIWARTAWGTHWQWDPKQVWTLAVWFSYAFLLHQRLAIGWRGHRAAVLSCSALVILLLLFVVENTFFTTIHRFNWL